MQINFNDIRSYKNCSKKLYEIYVCMPPKNTVVINKLEQADIVKMLNGKTYFTVDELEQIQKNGDGRFNIISQAVNSGKAYLVSNKTPFVLCGTVGELWTISADKLAKTYTFIQNGQPLQINQQSLNQRLKGSYLDWTLIRTSQQAISGQNMACFVPISQKGQIQTSWGAVLNINGVGVNHGKGDFIVCSKLPNGKPNLVDKWVVNGEIFATTYNNQGWADCLKLSGIKGITINSLPRLVPQQPVNNDKGVDANVFKQKCDTLMKELQKIYKFDVKSNTYETVKNYTGIAKEVEFVGDCYVAKYIVGGNFSHTYSVKDKATGNMTEKTVIATETDVWFGCSAVHGDSAISMTIRPRTNGLYLSGWVFPHNSNSKVTDDYPSCKVGTINDINCSEEVNLFKEKCNGRDVFIDNCKSNKGSESYLDVKALYSAIQYSKVRGSIGISHVLEEVYNNLSTDTVSERAKLCFEMYKSLDIGYGSASLLFAKQREEVNRGSMIGTNILSHKMNLSSLIKYLVSACQQEETKYDALRILYCLSETALSEAIIKLFYDTNNNLSVLWKRLDLKYMFNNKIDFYIYDSSEHDINSRRVCIDFSINDLKGIFVRCVYTASGKYAFDFIPKAPITEHNAGTTYSFDKDYNNYLGICKQLRDSCYRSLTEDASMAFRDNLPKHLIKTDFEYLGLLGNKVSYFFSAISINRDAHSLDYNKDTNTCRIKFSVGSNETRVIYMNEDDAHTVSVKCTLNGNSFEKSYKLSIKHNIDINAMLIFSDICKVLKIHPAKELLKSKRLWDSVTKTVSEKFNTEEYPKFDKDISSRIDKIVPVSINLLDTKYEILMRFYSNEKVIGERILVVDFNYENFDIRNSRSRSIKALNDLKSEFSITQMIFVMHYKYDSPHRSSTEHVTSFSESDIESALYWTTCELINSNKKYQV